METFEVGLNEFCLMILLEDYMGQGVECSSLNVISFHNLIESGTIRRYGFDGVCMDFLEKVSHFGVGFEVSYA